VSLHRYPTPEWLKGVVSPEIEDLMAGCGPGIQAAYRRLLGEQARAGGPNAAGRALELLLAGAGMRTGSKEAAE